MDRIFTNLRTLLMPVDSYMTPTSNSHADHADYADRADHVYYVDHADYAGHVEHAHHVSCWIIE